MGTISFPPPSLTPGAPQAVEGRRNGARAAGRAAAVERRAAADRVLAPIYARGDRYIGVLVASHLVVAALLAPVYGTWRVSAAVGGAAAGAFYLARALRPGAFLTRVTAGLALQTFCALHIHQMNGLAEMHFFYFTSVTAMILYQDWRALWPGVLANIVQHTFFAAGHNGGWHPGGQTFFEAAHVSPLKLTFHFGIALAQTAIASVAARALRARTLADAAKQYRLRESNAVLEAQGVELERSNQQLHEQTIELESQAEELQAAAAELELRSEEADRLRAEAEAANKAKSEFLAVMSHELRTPLNAIGGYAQLLEMELHGPVTLAQREALGRVQRSQRHLLGLINDVLDYAKLETGHVRYRVVPVAVADVVADLAPMIEPQLAAKRLAYTVDVPPGVRVAADREKVAQILLNLLSNAVKFTTAGGAVALRVAVEGSAPDCPPGPLPAPLPAGGRVCVSVWDTGIGVSADQLVRIFEPFVQVVQGLTRPHEGTGLGLAISRDLARGMGGDLTAESAPGMGSTFTLTLPAAAPTR